MQGHRDYVIKVLLERLERSARRQDVSRRDGADGRRSTDEWVAGVASYVRSSFGNSGGLVTPADVARVRAETAAARRRGRCRSSKRRCRARSMRSSGS